MTNFDNNVILWYKQGLWTMDMVESAHTKGKLSDEAYNEIKQLNNWELKFLNKKPKNNF